MTYPRAAAAFLSVRLTILLGYFMFFQKLEKQ
jgi:hypothetical protein